MKLCRNACTFCFMRQLPAHMRPSLSLRDDDFRLSFLSGTFVTLTNLSVEDEARIVEQRISRCAYRCMRAIRRLAARLSASTRRTASPRSTAFSRRASRCTRRSFLVEVNDGAVLRDTLSGRMRGRHRQHRRRAARLHETPKAFSTTASTTSAPRARGARRHRGVSAARSA